MDAFDRLFEAWMQSVWSVCLSATKMEVTSQRAQHKQGTD